MVGFSLSQWLELLSRVPFSKNRRRPHRITLPRIEGLEDRSLLTANLPAAVNDVYEMDANTTLNGRSVLVNDTDADGDTIDQAILDQTTANGSLSLAIDGTFDYTPTGGFVGTDTFTYFARDSANGENSASPATVVIHVGTGNQAPTANDATFTTPVNTQLEGDVTGSDPNGDPLQFFGGSVQSQHGFVSLTFAGRFTYTPDAGFVGTDTFTFVANDGTTDSAEATITIVVGNTDNNAPVATSIARSIDIDEVLNDQLSATDEDNDPLTFEIGGTSPAHGQVVINTDGSFTYTPDAGFSGTDSFKFIANDGTEDSAEGTVTINVGQGNSPPVADSATASTDVNTVLQGTLTGSDAENDPLTFQLGSEAPAHGSVVISANGSFTYTPTTGFTGTDSFTFIANDGTSDSAEATVSITVGNPGGNQAPVAEDGTISTDVDTPVNGTLQAADADSDPLTFEAGSIAPAHGAVVINSDGSFTYTPDAGFSGSDAFTFIANDGTTDSNEASITVTVGSTGNTAPVATSESVSTGLDTPLNGTLQATDADNDPLTFAIGNTLPAHGDVTVNTNGSYTYTPDAGFTGTDSFTFVANDGTEDSAEATITITVGGAGENTPPEATSESFTTPVNTALTGTLQGTDADGDTLVFLRGGTSPANGSLFVGSNGNFTYTPNTGFQGTDSFTFVVSDGTVNSSEATITITVGDTSGNSAPVAESQNLNTALNTPLNATLQATDAEGDSLTFALGSNSPDHGTLVINTDGSFTYTPDNGFSGTDAFTFVANDGTEDSAEATITIAVGDASGNTPPVATSASASTNVNTILHGTLQATDVDGDPLTFEIGSLQPAHGQVVVSSNGQFTYTPDNGFTGNDSFTFVANDGTIDSAEATITISVGGTSGNNAPVALSESVGTGVNTTLTGTLIATDPDGDSLTYSIGGTSPSHGTVFVQPNGAFTYIPNTGFTGVDSFTFFADDGTVSSNEATITITVGSTGGNTTPVAVSASLTTPINVALNGNLTGIDADGDDLTFALATFPTHGTVILNSNGSFTYTPDTDFTGIDSFFFRVNDGTNNSAAAIVSINVTGTGTGNTPPVANSQTVDTTINTPISGTLTGSDADGDAITFLAGGFDPQHGNVVISSNGTFTYTPDAGFTGNDSFSFRVNDGTANSTEAFVTVRVGTAATAPTANPTTIFTDINTAFAGQLTGSDPNGLPLTFAIGGISPTHGTISLNPNGTFTYIPEAGFTGNDLFTFKVHNGSETSADAAVIVRVGETINHAPMAFPRTITTSLDTEFTGTLNALDVDGDPLTFSAGSVTASHGVVIINSNGTFSYTPNNGYSGDDLFSFSVNDGTVSSIEALVTVHVDGGTGTAPTVVNGSGDLNEDEDFSSSLAPLGFDPQGDPLTFSIVSQPSHGTVSLSDDGNFIYTPNNGFNGTDSFVFKANDGTEDSNTATFTLQVGDTSTGSFDLQISAASDSPIAATRRDVTPLDPAASLVNVTPDVDFSNTALRASIIAAADSRDKLVVTDRDGAINVRGKRIFFNGIEVAKLSGGRRGDALQVAFNSSATEAAVNAVLQHIAIRTTKRAAGGTRTIELRVNADGVTSTATIDASLASPA